MDSTGSIQSRSSLLGCLNAYDIQQYLKVDTQEYLMVSKQLGRILILSDNDNTHSGQWMKDSTLGVNSTLGGNVYRSILYVDTE